MNFEQLHKNVFIQLHETSKDWHQKLLLFVDLDSTILTSYGQKEVYQPPIKPHFTALNRHFYIRPNLKEVFEALSPYYEFVVATRAARTYAESVLKRVDDDGKLFEGRILSSEMLDGDKESFLKYLNEDFKERIVVIDDFPPEWRDRSYVVEVLDFRGREANDYYHYIEDGCRKSAPYLDVLAKSLKQIHKDYFAYYENPENFPKTCTKDILTNLRSKLIQKFQICKLYIDDEPLPKRHVNTLSNYFYRRVEKTTTHILVKKLRDVPKKIIVKYPQVKSVTIEWLLHCLKGLQHCDEDHFKQS